MLVFKDGSIVLETGSWVAPYGIIFVADYLSIILVLTTAILSTACIFISPRLVSERKEQYYVYNFFFMLISGVSGAFLNRVFFNLFVFLAFLLIVSYVMLVFVLLLATFSDT